MTEPGDAVILLFDTTHHALWAEEVAREQSLPAEIVPAPSDARANCGLALQCLPTRASEVTDALDAEGVPYLPYG